MDIYSHVIPTLQKEAAEKIDEVLTPIPLEFILDHKSVVDEELEKKHLATDKTGKKKSPKHRTNNE